MRWLLFTFLCLVSIARLSANGSDDLKPTPEQRVVIDLVNAYFSHLQSPGNFEADTTKGRALEALKKYLIAQGGKPNDARVLEILGDMQEIHLHEEETRHAKILTNFKNHTSQRRKTS